LKKNKKDFFGFEESNQDSELPENDDSDFLNRLEDNGGEDDEEGEEGDSIMDRRTKQSALDRMLMPFDDDDDDDDMNRADLALPTCYDDEDDNEVDKYFDDNHLNPGESQENLFKVTMRSTAKSLKNPSRYDLDEDDDDLEVAFDRDDNDQDDDFSAKYLNVRNSFNTLAS
jgi:hypothetical protein